MQARIKEAKSATKTRREAVAQNTDKSTNPDQEGAIAKFGSYGKKLTTSLSKLTKRKANLYGSFNSTINGGALINPYGVSKSVTYLLMLACAVSATYWLMRVAQVPSAPGQSASGINKGITLYSNQDASAAYALFGNKPLVTENIYLRGVVITAKNKDGSLEGFAIFEIDGKPTNAISVGEGLGKGLTLQSIGDETATLLYQGQKLDFKLSKAGADKGEKTDRSNKGSDKNTSKK
jgi:hypothetical protein